MPWYAFLFAPFALIFRGITEVRNFLYDRQILKSFKSPIPTLIVGNLSVGGTGKTPMVEFLIKNLRDEVKLASLSRGYGRKTKGFIQAKGDSEPCEIGDEPLQIYRKFGAEIPVFVGEDRVSALEKIAHRIPMTDIVLLDDAFQHRKLKGDFYCLLTPFGSLFTNDFPLPMGRLRESRNGAKRADIIVVTKCPEKLPQAQKQIVRHGLKPYIKPDTPVFFSEIGYGNPYPLDHFEPLREPIILISGLANDLPLISYCKSRFKLLDVLTFPDHHQYQAGDLNKIQEMGDKHKSERPVLLTTEKDAVKLKSLSNRGFLGEIPIFVLPIEAKFESEDKQMLLSHIREKFTKKCSGKV
ncbi:lipid-A-disaccharide kinase [Algoriphagus alkaliphilus]|uniref:Tetraacyldisaccharide 4'-kinase n=1 Tax=Algoriphagus alkaliphilus TaxID=279824 RepID=A0A1G5YMH5_9BACT|nr:tetraacyldisaccharide 4'-kinase [Algoriphagus alkaliphilus]MBA4300144.1 tetraacyldisaccharide 4'-kinase [Cyclobacterium sp.]SDA83512.1 lipid-A-disaccharide kinase [Algoriphagus alkaliphilus]